jgi:hypothetical protein
MKCNLDEDKLSGFLLPEFLSVADVFQLVAAGYSKICVIGGEY